VTRHDVLQAFLESLEEAIAVSKSASEVNSVARQLFAALRSPAPHADQEARRLPACQHLHAALNSARQASPELDRLASAFAALEPHLKWISRNTSGPFASENWAKGHANSIIVGKGGVEDRDDVLVGVSLLAPHVRYPDHHHPPEEIYLVMTPGRFMHGSSGWFEPGRGGTLHNEPNINHAMASDESPLLAFWCLLTKPAGLSS
jgi:quercetin dioxygenase-like cupin family protein